MFLIRNEYIDYIYIYNMSQGLNTSLKKYVYNKRMEIFIIQK